MGNAWKEMMPQPNNRIAITTTRKRLLSAKSTRPRIMVRSLLLGVLQDESVLHYALSGLNARAYLLHIAGKHISAGNRHHRMNLTLLAVEGGFDEHPEAHEPRVLHFQANLGGAEVRVEGGTDIA